MQEFEKDYKSAIKKVELSDYLKKQLYSDIIVQKQKKRFRFKYALVSVVMIFLMSTCLVYGKELANVFNGYLWEHEILYYDSGNKVDIYKAYFKDVIEIPSDFPISDDDIEKNFNYSFFENYLDKKIIKSELMEMDYFKLKYLRNNGDNISFLSFEMDKVSLEKRFENIQLSFSLRTQYSTEEEKNSYFSYIPNCNFFTYHIKSLGVNAHIFDFQVYPQGEWAKGIIPIKARASFVYQDIIYTIVLNKVDYKVEDFYEILESFHEDL